MEEVRLLCENEFDDGSNDFSIGSTGFECSTKKDLNVNNMEGDAFSAQKIETSLAFSSTREKWYD